MKKGTWSKPTVYRGVKYRSRWECYLAKLLFYSDIDFKYEPQRFFLANKLSYLPDFYIPDYKIFIEVKGFLKASDEVKMKLFKIKYTPRLVYFGEAELERVFGDKARLVSGLDFDKYVPTKDELARFHKFLNKAMKEF